MTKKMTKIAVQPKVKIKLPTPKFVWTRKPINQEDVLNKFHEQIDELYYALKGKLEIISKAEEIISERFKWRFFRNTENPIVFTRLHDLNHSEYSYDDAPLQILGDARECFEKWKKDSSVDETRVFPMHGMKLYSSDAYALEIRMGDGDIDPAFYISTWQTRSIIWNDGARGLPIYNNWGHRKIVRFEDMDLSVKLKFSNDSGLIYAIDRIISNLLKVEEAIVNDKYSEICEKTKDGMGWFAFAPSSILLADKKQDQKVGMMSNNPDFHKYYAESIFS